MKISIITACFNSEETIEKSLRSVKSQTYIKNIEHIIIDGGSTDDTLKIIEREGAHVACLVSEPDDGIYNAMNKGVKLASGDVVAFLNADDFYKEEAALEKVCTLIEAGDYDVLYGDVEFFRPNRPSKVIRKYNSGNFTVDRLAYGWMPAHPALFVRRNLFCQYGFFEEDYQIAGDFEFVARIFKDNKLNSCYFPKTLVCMQTGGISTSGLSATIQLNREIMRACRSNKISTSWLKILMRYPSKVLEFLPFFRG